LLEPFGNLIHEVFFDDGSQEGISHLPNDDVLVALLVEFPL
jgi:hypothetical protein